MRFSPGKKMLEILNHKCSSRKVLNIIVYIKCSFKVHFTEYFDNDTITTIFSCNIYQIQSEILYYFFISTCDSLLARNWKLLHYNFVQNHSYIFLEYRKPQCLKIHKNKHQTLLKRISQDERSSNNIGINKTA